MTLALIAGAGALPAALAATLAERPFIAALDGFPPEGLAPDLTFRIERLYPFFAALHAEGITRIAFAGAVRRPRLDPALFDAATAQIVPRLMHSLAQGDDATLREVIALFEEEGFEITGAAEIAPALVPPEGLYAGALTPPCARCWRCSRKRASGSPVPPRSRRRWCRPRGYMPAR
jgi:DUF1009 family protein